MARRGRALTSASEDLYRTVFAATAPERRRAHAVRTATANAKSRITRQRFPPARMYLFRPRKYRRMPNDSRLRFGAGNVPAFTLHSIAGNSRARAIAIQLTMHIKRVIRLVGHGCDDPIAGAVAQRSKAHADVEIRESLCFDAPPFAQRAQRACCRGYRGWCGYRAAEAQRNPRRSWALGRDTIRAKPSAIRGPPGQCPSARLGPLPRRKVVASCEGARQEFRQIIQRADRQWLGHFPLVRHIGKEQPSVRSR